MNLGIEEFDRGFLAGIAAHDDELVLEQADTIDELRERIGQTERTVRRYRRYWFVQIWLTVALLVPWEARVMLWAVRALGW
jgi:hypothetical protein